MPKKAAPSHALALALLLAGCAAADAPPPAPTPPPGSDAAYEHPASGLLFPASVGAFRRVDIFRQDPSGTSLSVGYAMADQAGPVTAIVHVYPAETPSGSLSLFGGPEATTAERSAPQLAAMQAEMRRLHPGFHLDAESDAFLLQAGVTQTGREAVMSYDDIGAASPGRGRVITDAYAFCCRRRNRAVIYRFQYAAAAADLALPIANFMRDLQWTTMADTAPASRPAAPPMPH